MNKILEQGIISFKQAAKPFAEAAKRWGKLMRSTEELLASHIDDEPSLTRRLECERRCRHTDRYFLQDHSEDDDPEEVTKQEYDQYVGDETVEEYGMYMSGANQTVHTKVVT